MTAASSGSLGDRVAAVLRDIPDFPEPGVVFKDITPLLADPALRAEVVEAIAARHEGRVDAVAGLEARGFILGSLVAQHLGISFVPIRKAGKLPWRTHAVDYELEYGSATLEVHQDAFAAGDRVLIVDDVLATGGTAAAGAALVAKCRAEVAAVEVLLELGFLAGRSALTGYDVRSVLAI